MTCPHCGAQVIPGSRFCNKCRKRVAAGSPAASRPTQAPPRAPGPPRDSSAPRIDASNTSASPGFTRPGVVTLLGVLNIIGGVVAIGLVAVMVFVMVAAEGGIEGAGVALVLFAAYAVIAAVQIATGVGLLRLEPWGRTLQIGLAVVGLLGIPCGTIISILILVYMFKAEVKILFSGISPRRLPPAQVAAVERLSQGSGATIAIIVVVGGIAAVAFIGIVAAIAIPSLLRARVSANESATIGDLRTMVSAQHSYSSANEGFPDQPSCLVTPIQCIPGYAETSPVFLDESFMTTSRHGYEFHFAVGPPAAPEIVQRGQVSPTSLSGWAYVAVPLSPMQTGVRSFCADMSGAICYRADGTPPDASTGACPVSNEIRPGSCVPMTSPN